MTHTLPSINETDEAILLEVRLEDTIRLLKIFTKLIAMFPEQRFSQILDNYGFVEGDLTDQSVWTDEYGVEPSVVLKRVLVKTKGLEIEGV